MHSGESFRIRGKRRLFASRAARPQPWLPLGGEGYSVRGRTFNSLRSDLSALCGLYPILPTASSCGCGVSPARRGSRGHPPCSSFFFPLFLSPEKEKRTDTGAVVKSLLEIIIRQRKFLRNKQGTTNENPVKQCFHREHERLKRRDMLCPKNL